MRVRSFAPAATATVLAAVLSVALFSPLGWARPVSSAQGGGVSTGCDRACLYGFLDQYLAALAAKDPARLPWAAHVKFTENNVVLQIGDGLWGTISARGPDDLKAADSETGQAAYFGVVDERGNQAFFALRLKIEDGKISEV